MKGVFKPLTADEVTFTLAIEDEVIPVRGNAMASGDDAADKQAEDEILEQLDRGNQWAWCCVVVTARWKDWSETDTLGACSYADEADFKRGGYYESMQSEALAHLNETLAKHYEALAARAETSP